MLELIKELNDFENLLKIDTDNITERNKRKEKDEITKINEEKNKNEKMYERNKKIINEIKNKIVNINDTNLEMNQKIQKINLNTQNYILIPKINFTPNEKEVNIDSRILYKARLPYCICDRSFAWNRYRLYFRCRLSYRQLQHTSLSYKDLPIIFRVSLFRLQA